MYKFSRLERLPKNLGDATNCWISKRYVWFLLLHWNNNNNTIVTIIITIPVTSVIITIIITEPVGLLRQDGKCPDGPAVVEGKAAGMGRHSPGHVCRRPRQKHNHGNRRCSQPCRHQQDQQIQPTIRNSHLHSSGHRNSRYLAPPGSWAGPGTGKAGDHNHRRLQRSPTCSSSYQWLCKRGTRSRFRTRSEPASLMQPVIYLS